MTDNLNINMDLSRQSTIAASIEKIYESTGIIESTFVVDSNLYAVIRRTDPFISQLTKHETYPLFGNDLNISEDMLSPFEVLNRIDNVDLSTLVVDPKTYIGGFVKVRERNNLIVRVEYIGKTPYILDALKLNQNAIRSARRFIGGTGTLNQGLAKEYLKKLGLNDSQIDIIGSTKLKDWYDNVIRLKDDGTYSNDTNQEVKGEKILDLLELTDYISNKNEKPMKTKKCHLPVTIFSAR